MPSRHKSSGFLKSTYRSPITIYFCGVFFGKINIDVLRCAFSREMWLHWVARPRMIRPDLACALWLIAWMRTSDRNVPDLDPGRVNWQTRAGAPRTRCMDSPLENLWNPARDCRAGAMRQFRSGQLDSMLLNLVQLCTHTHLLYYCINTIWRLWISVPRQVKIKRIELYSQIQNSTYKSMTD
jgi:hypothetical protein